jgi:5-methylcytosine-specific restriction enzyme subunit McrC
MTTVASPVRVMVPEYGTVIVECAPPSPADREAADVLAVAGDDAKIRVRWLIDGRAEISASSWVGVIRFSTLDIRVVPKLVGDELNVLGMIAFASGVDVLRRLPNLRALPPSGADFLQLVCLLLAEEAWGVMRQGLLRDYRSTEEALGVLRGRLNIREQYLRRFGRLDQLECRFDEYDGDIPENQLLSAALSVARYLAQGPELCFEIGRLAAIWSEACVPTVLDPQWYLNRITYDRRNRHYQAGHTLAALLLRYAGFTDVFDSRPGAVRTFLVDMNALFERFIERLVTEAFRDSPLRVSAQHPLEAVIRNDTTGRKYPPVRPDLVISHTQLGEQVPFDAKYKRYDLKKVSTPDIYQTFLYAYALGANETRRAAIIHPTTGGTTLATLSVHSTAGGLGARISVVGIDVPAVLVALSASPGERAAALQTVAKTVRTVCGFAGDDFATTTTGTTGAS